MGDREPPGRRPTPPSAPGGGSPRPPRVPGVGGTGGRRGGGGRPGSGGGPPEGQVISHIVSPRGQTLMELWELGREDEKMTIRGRLMGRFPSLMYAHPRESGKMLGFLLRPAVLGYILSFPFLWLAETLRGEVDAERRRRAMEVMDALAALAVGALVFAALGYMATSAVEIGTALVIVGAAQLTAASAVGSPGGVLGAVSSAIGVELIVVGATDTGLILAPLAGVPAFAAYAVLGPWADDRGLRSGRALIWSVGVGGVISGGYLLLEVRNVLGTAGAPTGAVIALAFFAVFHGERFTADEFWARWGVVPFAVSAILVAVAAAPVPGHAKAAAVVALAAATVGLGTTVASLRVAAFVLGILLAVVGAGMLWTGDLQGAAATSVTVIGAVGWGVARRLGFSGWPWAFGTLAAVGAAAGGLVGPSEPLWALATSAGLVAGGLLGGSSQGWADRVVPLYASGVVVGAVGSSGASLTDGPGLALLAGVVLVALVAPAIGRALDGRGIATGPEAAAGAVVLLGVRGALGWVPLDLVVVAALVAAGAGAVAWLLEWDGAPTLVGVAAPVLVGAAGVLAGLDPYAAIAVGVAAIPLARVGRGAVTGGSTAAVGTATTALVAGPWWPTAVGGWAVLVGAQRSRANVWRLLVGLGATAVVGATIADPGLRPAGGLVAAGVGVFLMPVVWSHGWGAAVVSGAVLAALFPETGDALGSWVAVVPATAGLAVGAVWRRWAVIEGAAVASLVASVWTSVADGTSVTGALVFAALGVLGAISWWLRPAEEDEPTAEEATALEEPAAVPSDEEGLGGRAGLGAAADLVWITLAVSGAAAHLAGSLGAHVAGGAAAAVGIGAVLLAGTRPPEAEGSRTGLRIGGGAVAQGVALAWVVADAEGAASLAAAGPLVWGALAVVEPRRSYVPPATFGVGVWAIAVMSGFPIHLPSWVEVGALAVGGALAAAAAMWAEGRLDRGVARASGSVGRTAARSIGGGVVALAALGAAGVVLVAAAALDPLVRAGVGDMVFRLGRWFGSFGLP